MVYLLLEIVDDALSSLVNVIALALIEEGVDRGDDALLQRVSVREEKNRQDHLDDDDHQQEYRVLESGNFGENFGENEE